MNKTKIIQITKEYGLAPNKKFGQNFLFDANIITKIINAIQPTETDNILEIGPGLGSLTEILLQKAGSLTAVEIDAGIVKYLNTFVNKNNFSLIHCDFLKAEINLNFNKIVSNLPYYCASEILFKIAQKFDADLFVMMQKEMAERIIATPGTKNYGALSITLGLHYKANIMFNVSGNAFYPSPDVASSFVMLKRLDLKLNVLELDMFKSLVKSAFWGRRKTLLTALVESPHLNFKKEELKELILKSSLDEKCRGEQLSVDDFIRLTKNANHYTLRK